jgi:polysaccharide biosynthesis transport protein
MSSGRQEAGQFATRFNEYKSRQDELGELETAYRDAVQRRAKLEASERARTPTTKVLEAATTPLQPWRPLYWRDTALSIGGSLALALLAMWLVELFNRSEPQPAVVLIQPQGGRLPYDAAPQMLPGQNTPSGALEAQTPGLLPQPPTFPRELSDTEIAALLRASDDDCRLAILLLMSGVTTDEAVKLRWSDVALPRGFVHVGGDSARNVTLSEASCRLLAVRPKAATGSTLLLGQSVHPMTRDNMDAQILCAAHDAGIDGAAQITSDALRHTYVAFLVRQGIRFGDLVQLVGPMPAELLGMYSLLSPPGSKVARQDIHVEHPAVGRAPTR